MSKLLQGEAELRQISAILARLAVRADTSAKVIHDTDRLPTEPRERPSEAAAPGRTKDDLALVETLFAERRQRDGFFTDHTYLLGEPAWDILLYLYIGRKRGWAVSVAHASRASGAPPTSALRWIARLEDDALVCRSGDTFDRRRSLIALTDTAVIMMENYIRSLQTPH